MNTSYNLELIEDGFDTLMRLKEVPLTESDKNLSKRFHVIFASGNKMGDAVMYFDNYIGLFIGAGKEIRSPKTYRLIAIN